ncbi:phosphoenolpyruvate--protein phosphotransferase [Lachnospiraceae bacterium NSJ-143]|nr:phosphoenolpyruvate--protein phosphotransferase [Lachnospiraceae bacterium NSJ-143]
MITKNGKGVFGGVAFGNIKIFNEHKTIKKYFTTDTVGEKARFENARNKAYDETVRLMEKTRDEVGEKEAAIFEIHSMMINDDDFVSAVVSKIEGGINAEAAVHEAGEQMAEQFSSLNDSYMKQRAADVIDVAERVVNAFGDTDIKKDSHEEKSIIVAYDLTPSQTVQLRDQNISGFITEGGSGNSHTAILARTMNIPAVIGVKGILDEAYDGRFAAVDSSSGTIYIEPNATTIKRLKDKKEKSDNEIQLLQRYKGVKTVTRGGRNVMLYANISNMTDMDMVLANDAEGIGLFRSEFIFMGRSTFPSEAEQFDIYKKAVEKMEGKRVIIRTLDIGADKKVDYFNLPDEENPALGYRAIRICLDRTNIFKVQLRAILKASVYGKTAIMFPMICTLEELRKAKEILNEVKLELDFEGVRYDRNIEVGIMIETPAAALISETLARECDFFSIGTNDLTQYTLAVDRQNSMVNSKFDTDHESILRLIRFTAQNAKKEGIWIGICGELGADKRLTERFIKWGIDELSVSPVYILGLRKYITEMDI